LLVRRAHLRDAPAPNSLGAEPLAASAARRSRLLTGDARFPEHVASGYGYLFSQQHGLPSIGIRQALRQKNEPRLRIVTYLVIPTALA